MESKSRTGKSIKNSTVAMSLYAVNLVLQFFSRKVFLDYLGTEILGLNTTATNLLQFLNLAELGIGAAVAFTLYQPLFENDKSTINEIISLQGWFYRRIAYFIIAGSLIMMCFFPIIFSKMNLPIWYAYASFIVLLLSALLSYFVNYKQIILSSDQKDYKILLSYKLVMLIKVVFQIITISSFPHGYIWWLVLEVVFAFIASFVLNRTIIKTYPYLSTNISTGKRLQKKYPLIIKKIKQVFFHKIGGFVLTQTSPLIIYAFTTLSLVAVYGNYLILISGVTSLMSSMFNGITSSIGNLIAQGEKDRIIKVFQELFSLRFYFCIIICVGIYFVSPSFITIWIGPEYILNNSTVLIIVVTLYITLSKSTIESFINATGLYGDIYAPIFESILNIGLSILIGYYYGLNGILTGVLISQVLVIFLWKPYYFFSRKYPEELMTYVSGYIKLIIPTAFVTVIFAIVMKQIDSISLSSIASFWTHIFMVLVYAIILILLLIISNISFKNGLKRVFNAIKK